MTIQVTGGTTNSPPAVQTLQLVNDTGTPGDLITTDPRISAMLMDVDGGGMSYSYQIDWNNDEAADASMMVGLNTPFTYDLTNRVPYGTVTAKVRGTQTTMTGTTYGAWSTLSFNYQSPATNAAPVVQNLALVNDTGTPGDGVTTDLRITASLSDPDGGGMSYSYEVGWTNDGISDTTMSTALNTPFMYDLATRIPYGTSTVRVRGTQMGMSGTSYGAWSTLTLTSQAPPQNAPPTVTLSGTTTTLTENQSILSNLAVGTITVTDDGQGTNTVWLSGADAALFMIVGSGLFLKSGTLLDFETNPTLDVTVNVDDATVGLTVDSSQALSIAVTNVNETSTLTLATPMSSVPENTSVPARWLVAGLTVSQDGLGTDTLLLSGADAALFEIVSGQLYLKAGTALDFETNPTLDVTVSVQDSVLGVGPGGTQSLAISVTNVNETPTLALTNVTPSLVENLNTTSAILMGNVVITDDALGTNTLSLSGPDAALFEITGGQLFLRAGTLLDYETRTTLNVTINLDDSTLGTGVDDSQPVTIDITNVMEDLTVRLLNTVTSLSESTSTAGDIRVADIVVTDDVAGGSPLTLSLVRMPRCFRFWERNCT